MRPPLSFLAILIASALPCAAHATPMSAGTYTLTDLTAPQGFAANTFDPITGTVTINANGLISGGTLTFDDLALSSPANSGNYLTFSFNDSYTSGNPVVNTANFVGANGQINLVYVPTLNALGDISLAVCNSCESYADSYIQIDSSTPGYNSYEIGNLNAGTLDSNTSVNTGMNTGANTADASEPSSLILLCTGIFGGAYLMRRKFLKPDNANSRLHP